MRKFLAALVLRNGDIVCDPTLTDSHQELIEHAGIDRSECACIRFTPQRLGDYTNPDGYALRVDGSSIPAWFDAQMQARTANALRDRVRSMIINDRRPLTTGGCWIVGPGGDAGDVVGGRIVYVAPGGRVGDVRDRGYVGHVRGTVGDVCHGGVVRSVRLGGQVGNVHSGGRVGDVWVGGMVGVVWGRVGDVWGFVGNVMAGGVVGDVAGTVGNVHSGGTVGNVLPGGRIGSDQRHGSA